MQTQFIPQNACFLFQCMLHHNIFWYFSVRLLIRTYCFPSSISCFLRHFPRIFHRDEASKATETSPDVEKAISIAEIQRCGTFYNHTLTFDSALTQKSYGGCTTFNNHVNLQWVRHLHIVCVSTKLCWLWPKVHFCRKCNKRMYRWAVRWAT